MVPMTLLFNYKTNLLGETGIIAENVRMIIRMHPKWNVIFDTDVTCLDKINKMLKLTEVVAWYNDPQTLGKHKSDLCRLVQLYREGGVYVDNDLELLMPLPSEILRGDMATVLSVDPGTIFQALVAAVPEHSIVFKSLTLFVEVIQGKYTPRGWIGPSIMYDAMGTNRSEVYLLYEKHAYITGRKRSDACDFVVQTNNGTVLAYSRVATWGNVDRFKTSCYTRPLAPKPAPAQRPLYAPSMPSPIAYWSNHLFAF